jgi:hypothetical protein
MGGDMDLIWGKREGIYFCERDWTGGIRLKPKENFFSARTRRDKIIALNASIKNATLVRKRGIFSLAWVGALEKIQHHLWERAWRATF